MAPYYQCGKCAFRGSTSNMSWHVANRHAPLEDTPFYCKECSIRFRIQSQAEHHILVRHPETEASNTIGGTGHAYHLKPTDATLLSAPPVPPTACARTYGLRPATSTVVKPSTSSAESTRPAPKPVQASQPSTSKPQKRTRTEVIHPGPQRKSRSLTRKKRYSRFDGSPSSTSSSDSGTRSPGEKWFPSSSSSSAKSSSTSSSGATTPDFTPFSSPSRAQTPPTSPTRSQLVDSPNPSCSHASPAHKPMPAASSREPQSEGVNPAPSNSCQQDLASHR